mmetsp:Transcript_88707/g.156529  ORF Transcript_88707/g.156529 Transcript_88707/m.156529 type:complete len:84 (+) Transcript_88707:74-325(+)
MIFSGAIVIAIAAVWLYFCGLSLSPQQAKSSGVPGNENKEKSEAQGAKGDNVFVGKDTNYCQDCHCESEPGAELKSNKLNESC